jgi:hypothetical protein
MSDTPTLSCGHAAHTYTEDGQEYCSICGVLDETEDPTDETDIDEEDLDETADDD